MKVEPFIQKTSNLYAENRLLKFTVICLAIAVVIASYFSYAALKYQKVVILPPIVDKRIVVSGNDVNENYIRLFTRYSMTLLNNYTPGSASGQFSELLALASPEFYPDLQKKLNSLESTISKLNLTSAFYPQRLKIDVEKKIIEITGNKKQFAGGTSIEDGQKKYKINYIVLNGRFYIDGIKEVSLK